MKKNLLLLLIFIVTIKPGKEIINIDEDKKNIEEYTQLSKQITFIIEERYLKKLIASIRYFNHDVDFKHKKEQDTSHPFVVACLYGEKRLQQVILSHGFNLYYQDGKGRNFLHLAILYNNQALLAFAFQTEDFNFDQQDNKGQTPLMLACKNKRFKLTNHLLCYGADPNKKDKNGMSAKNYGKEIFSKRHFKILFEKISTENSNASTPKPRRRNSHLAKRWKSSGDTLDLVEN